MNAPMSATYAETIDLIRQAERHVVHAIAIELDRSKLGIEAVQALILYRLGTDEVMVSELRRRGYYLGSNVSYNLKKLVEMGFLDHQQSPVDRRSMRIKATARGREVGAIIAALFERQANDAIALGDLDVGGLTALSAALRRLNSFLTERNLYKQV
jgi:DNA-binding MarR family transcriptional regulator